MQVTVNKRKTRMHSSRMRTGRSLTICLSLLRGGGVPKEIKEKIKKTIKKTIFKKSKKNWGGNTPPDHTAQTTPPPGPHPPGPDHTPQITPPPLDHTPRTRPPRD